METMKKREVLRFRMPALAYVPCVPVNLYDLTILSCCCCRRCCRTPASPISLRFWFMLPSHSYFFSEYVFHRHCALCAVVRLFTIKEHVRFHNFYFPVIYAHHVDAVSSMTSRGKKTKIFLLSSLFDFAFHSSHAKVSDDPRQYVVVVVVVRQWIVLACLR